MLPVLPLFVRHGISNPVFLLDEANSQPAEMDSLKG
jgi:hypothetical protein